MLNEKAPSVQIHIGSVCTVGMKIVFIAFPLFANDLTVWLGKEQSCLSFMYELGLYFMTWERLWSSECRFVDNVSNKMPLLRLYSRFRKQNLDYLCDFKSV